MTDIINKMENEFKSATDWMQSQFASVRTGRANAHILDQVKVSYYDQMTPVLHLASARPKGAKEIVLNVYEKDKMQLIYNAIMKANLDVSVRIDSDSILITFPDITSEVRENLIKKVKQILEEAKTKLRQSRHHAINALKNKENNFSENEKNIKTKKINESQKKAETNLETISAKKIKELQVI